MENIPMAKQQPFSWDSSSSDSDSEKLVSKKELSLLSFFNFCGISSSTLRKVVVFFSVCFVLLLPGFIDFIVHITTSSPADRQSENVFLSGKVKIGGIALVLWSIFFCSAYVVFVLLGFVIIIAPHFIVRVVQFFSGSLPRNIDIYVGYAQDLKVHIRNFIFSLLLLVTWGALFRRAEYENIPEESWRLVSFNVIACFFATSLLILMQKSLLQIIAVRFHRTAYLERLRHIRSCSDVISVLSEAASKRLKFREQIISNETKRSKMGLFSNDASLQRHGAWRKTFLSPKAKGESKDDSAISKITPISDDDERLKSASIGDNSAVPVGTVRRTRSIDNGIAGSPSRGALLAFVDKSPESPKLHSEVSLNSTRNDKKSSFFGMRIHRSKNDSKKKEPTISSDGSSATNYVPEFLYKLTKHITHGIDINSGHEARKLAKRIFDGLGPSTSELLNNYRNRTDSSFVRKTRPMDELILDDFLPHFESLDEAKKAMEIFDKDGNGSISAQELKDGVVSIYKERKALAQSLRDVGSAVGKLDIMLSVLVVILSIITWLLIFGVSLGPFVVTGISMIVAVTFIFGNSAKNVFEGIIFLFLTHPYDVGDRVFIDGQNLVVKELGILTTVFQRWDGQSTSTLTHCKEPNIIVIYSPNALLMTKNISNIRRSPNQLEIVEVHIDFETPQDKMNALKRKMLEFLHAEARDYIPKLEIIPVEIENLNKLKFHLYLEHKTNWQESDRRWARRNKFMFALKQTLEEIGISYHKLPQPVKLERK